MTDLNAAPNRVPWPPILYLLAIVVAAVLGLLFPLPWITEPLSDLLYAAGWLAVAGVAAIYYSAMRTLKRAKTTIRPDRPSEHLVTSGAFSFTRNPIYFANTLLMIAIGLITANIWFIALAVVAAFATQKLAIVPEEKHLQARFGKKYIDYSKRVRRWI
ncbi:methyltransferase family protein [Aminobacter carboxidus]|uniref:Isoprenylcysteine carboxylmethyltransferase family protein n=1 Tax=Aminobacter carboxidus TaxID=376165 RepID=A0A8E1WBS2_9HYPH|nr:MULTISPECIES: isoprenylcysteine carboxylmethyltransferase family protein [Aminobacter carboxidus group]MBB6464705.1 protein-S-isoprenylcysteine O-methyltransferase Ste14 [Aminobacter lissarensis]MBE1206799.1 isoprenylcysteine carboxylmethyltransferase family protein [Aminobacter carboxidus]